MREFDAMEAEQVGVGVLVCWWMVGVWSDFVWLWMVDGGGRWSLSPHHCMHDLCVRYAYPVPSTHARPVCQICLSCPLHPLNPNSLTLPKPNNRWPAPMPSTSCWPPPRPPPSRSRRPRGASWSAAAALGTSPLRVRGWVRKGGEGRIQTGMQTGRQTDRQTPPHPHPHTALHTYPPPPPPTPPQHQPPSCNALLTQTLPPPPIPHTTSPGAMLGGPPLLPRLPPALRPDPPLRGAAHHAALHDVGGGQSLFS